MSSSSEAHWPLVAMKTRSAWAICRRSRTVIRGGHPLQREFIDYKEKGCTDQKANKRAHERIVAQALLHFKRGARRVALGNNVSVFALNPSFLLRRTIHRPNFSAALLRRLNVFLKGGSSMTVWPRQRFFCS